MDNVLGTRIKKLRQKAHLSQTDFAEILHVRNSTLSQYESGHRSPNDEIKKLIADYFNVSIDYLLGRTSEKQTLSDCCANRMFSIELDIEKLNLSQTDFNDLKDALSHADYDTLKAIIQLLKIRSARMVS